MTADAQWDSTRWRDDGDTPRYDSLQQHPQHSALHTPQTGTRDSPAQTWFGTSQEQMKSYPYDSRPSSQTFAGHQSQHVQSDRPTQPSYGSANHSSPHHAANYGTWRSDTSQAPGSGERRSADASLSLQIPKSTSSGTSGNKKSRVQG